MNVTSVGGVPVSAKCKTLASFRARIEQVSMAFSTEEIVAELAAVGVVSAHKYPYMGARGSLSQKGKILLVFDRPPPPSVFLGYRSHAVTMEIAKPLKCFNCQRLGHHSSRCSLPRACKRCGKPGHLMANCTNQPQCVNCRGPHAAGSKECPREAFATEKNRLMMEARILQQVRVAEPSAFIAASTQPSSQEKVSFPQAVEDAPTKTFASVVRSIAVEESGLATPKVLLPKPRAIPKRHRRTARRPPSRARSSKKRAKVNKRNTRSSLKDAGRKQLTSLSAVADLLSCFSPQAAEAVRTLATLLQPLLSLIQGLQGGKLPTTKG